MVFYSGTLARRYGVLNLIKAFSLIVDSSYRLWICGEGDSRSEIQDFSKNDKRIFYYGQLPTEKVFQLQKQATVLVNPRTSEGEFSKYSFPSKTMEYLASGTPTILFKLDGIPDEYLQYCFTVKQETVECLSETIVTVCSKSQEDLFEFGRKASNFIKNFKNPEFQVNKIKDMLLTLHN